MMTQEQLMDRMFVLIGDIQLSARKREEIEKNPSMIPILAKREELIKELYELAGVWAHRDLTIKQGLPMMPNDKCEQIWSKANAIAKSMFSLNM